MHSQQIQVVHTNVLSVVDASLHLGWIIWQGKFFLLSNQVGTWSV